jgi:hypothetical protein
LVVLAALGSTLVAATVAMALVLSLHNRGFTEIGTRGIKAQGLSGDAESRILAEQEGVIRKMKKAIEEMETARAD